MRKKKGKKSFDYYLSMPTAMCANMLILFIGVTQFFSSIIYYYFDCICSMFDFECRNWCQLKVHIKRKKELHETNSFLNQ